MFLSNYGLPLRRFSRNSQPLKFLVDIFLPEFCLKSAENVENTGKISFTPVSKVWLVGRDSLVGIATRYELDGPGIESV